jgi:hypothetical protein
MVRERTVRVRAKLSANVDMRVPRAGDRVAER